MTAPALQAVVFALRAETFAVPVTLVREILDHRAAAAMPEGPDWLLGVIDVRGAAVPMVDLRVRLGLPVATVDLATRILVVAVALPDGRTVTLGLVVDRVIEVATFAAGEVEPTPDIGIRWHADYLRGVVRRDGGFVFVLDLASLATAQDDLAMIAHAA